MPESAEYPITLYDPDGGVVRDYADAAALIAGVQNLDTDELGPGSRRWLVDAGGRRVRARIAFGRIERLEILPGRPPLPETLARLRETALANEEDRDGDARTALVAARVGAGVLLPVAACSFLWNWWPWITNPFLRTNTWDLPFVSVAFVGAALLALVWFGRRRYALLGLALLCVGGSVLGAVRGWRLMAAFTAPSAGLSLPTLVLQWGWDLATPGLLFTLSGMLLIFYGKTYAALARRRG